MSEMIIAASCTALKLCSRSGQSQSHGNADLPGRLFLSRDSLPERCPPEMHTILSLMKH